MAKLLAAEGKEVDEEARGADEDALPIDLCKCVSHTRTRMRLVFPGKMHTHAHAYTHTCTYT